LRGDQQLPCRQHIHGRLGADLSPPRWPRAIRDGLHGLSQCPCTCAIWLITP
jgi:hypothetical protein